MLGEPLQSPKSYIIALNNQFLDRPKKKKKQQQQQTKQKKLLKKHQQKENKWIKVLFQVQKQLVQLVDISILVRRKPE